MRPYRGALFLFPKKPRRKKNGSGGEGERFMADFADFEVSRDDFTPGMQGVLNTCGSPFELGILGPGAVRSMKAFHDAIRRRLAGDEKNFFLDKDLGYFEKLYGEGTGTGIGILSGGRLIAQAVILNPTRENPRTGMVDMPAVAPPESVSILQCVGVLPEQRGNNLMDKLIDGWIAQAAAQGRTDVMAEIELRNVASWHNFMKGGLSLAGIGIDPADGALLYNAHEKLAAIPGKKMSSAFNRASGAALSVCRLENIEKQQELFTAGHRAVGYYKPRQALIFRKDQSSLLMP